MMTEKINFYLYGVFGGDLPSSQKQKGIGDEDVEFLKFSTINLIVSPIEVDEVIPTEQNLRRHEEVLSNMRNQISEILPVAFGTIADRNSLRNFVSRNEDSIKRQLKQFHNKVEYEIRASWDDLVEMVKNSAHGDEGVASIQQQIVSKPLGIFETVEVGKVIESRINDKRKEYKDTVLSSIWKIIDSYTESPIRSEVMVFNVAVLMDQSKTEKLEAALSDQERKLRKQKISMSIAGPLIPFHFIRLPVEFIKAEKNYANH